MATAKRRCILFLLMVGWVTGISTIHAEDRAGDRFILRGGERIVFFGDSITQGGNYISYFEAYLLARYPDKKFTIINHGISSETISGTSEIDHQPRRPWALPRFTRDIARWKPDIVVACFGMNDGNYHPFEETRYQKYQQGVATLQKRIADETRGRLILMTPPPFDPYYRRVQDPKAVHFGYKYAAINYDDTLAAYSRHVVSLRSPTQMVVDLHSRMNEHVTTRRKQQVSFTVSPDAIHPNATGHLLMTLGLLETLQAPPIHVEAQIAANGRVVAGNIADVRRAPQAISFRWTAPLPFPADPTWDEPSLRLAQWDRKFQRCRLQVEGLPAGDYTIQYGGPSGMTVTARELALGIELSLNDNFPPRQRGMLLLKKLQARNRLIYSAWRRSIDKPLTPRPAPNEELEVKNLQSEIEELRRPIVMPVTISRVVIDRKPVPVKPAPGK